MGDTKRKMLTPAERVAKLEDQLLAAREKEQAKYRKERDTLGSELSKLVAKRDELVEKIQAKAGRLEELDGLIDADDRAEAEVVELARQG